ncbi:hypothetical protein XW59_029050 [Aquamicrobium sp. LC103]|nr:hypothetical protein XW59_029050 [Aquamicrobium sp. LC103]
MPAPVFSPKRTTQTVVKFNLSFFLQGFDVQQPAGEYRVEKEEELIDGLSRLAWHCTATFIYLPAIAPGNRPRQVLQIDPAELEDALKKDRLRT